MTVFDTLSQLSADTLPQFVMISGEDDDIISALKLQLMAKVNFDPSDLSQAYFDLSEADPDLALEELESLPFFGDEMLVVFENVWELTTVKKSVLTENQLLRFEQLLDNPLASTRLVIICHGKLDGKRRIVKKLKQIALHLEATPLKPHELSQYFVNKSSLHANIVNLIIEKSNSHFATVGQNIALVTTYADGRQVTLEDVIKLLAILTNNFRLYYQIKLLLDKKYTERQLIDYLKINPYRLKFLVTPARSRSKAFLAAAMRYLIDTDFKIKSGQADKKFLMDMVLIRLSGIS